MDPEDLADRIQNSGETSRQELRRLPKGVLLGIAIELDPDTVADLDAEGFSKEDIIGIIITHVKASLGRQQVEGWEVIGDVDVVSAEGYSDTEEPEDTVDEDAPGGPEMQGPDLSHLRRWG